MIRHILTLLAAPDRGAIVRIIEAKDDGEYTEARYARDGAQLADLLVRVLPLPTLQALARAIYARAGMQREKEQSK